jgi:hypothetical protein
MILHQQFKNIGFSDKIRLIINCSDKMHGKENFPFRVLWSSGQSSWLHIRRPGFDFRDYQKKKVVGLERGPLSLVNTTEELLDRKVAAPV